jgi:hypothetical protein
MMSSDAWARLVHALRERPGDRPRPWSVAACVAVLQLPHGSIVVARDADDDTLMVEAWDTDGEVLDRLVVLADDQTSGGSLRASLSGLVGDIWRRADLPLSA